MIQNAGGRHRILPSRKDKLGDGCVAQVGIPTVSERHARQLAS